MKTYRCPTCGKSLTKSEYEKALRIHGEREKHLAEKEAELKQRNWTGNVSDGQESANSSRSITGGCKKRETWFANKKGLGLIASRSASRSNSNV